MFEIHFYEDKDGNSPIYEYLKGLSQRTDKDNRINHNKINDYIQVLSEYGKAAGEPYIKHLDGDIWELRPIRGRIFFCKLDGQRLYSAPPFYKENTKDPET